LLKDAPTLVQVANRLTDPLIRVEPDLLTYDDIARLGIGV